MNPIKKSLYHLIKHLAEYFLLTTVPILSHPFKRPLIGGLKLYRYSKLQRDTGFFFSLFFFFFGGKYESDKEIVVLLNFDQTSSRILPLNNSTYFVPSI